MPNQINHSSKLEKMYLKIMHKDLKTEMYIINTRWYLREWYERNMIQVRFLSLNFLLKKSIAMFNKLALESKPLLYIFLKFNRTQIYE